jgi:phosphonate transport system substrate-binding protein
MTKVRQRQFLLLVFFTAAVLPSVTPSPISAQARDPSDIKRLSLGLISEVNRREIEEHFRDFVRYAARKLSPEAEIEASVIIAPTPFELAKLLEQRKVDFYIESAYPTYIINIVHGQGRLLLRRWKGGVADYYSLIFTKRDGDIKRLEDLKGKLIVFEDAGSTSGYLLPKLYLLRRGLKLREKKGFSVDSEPTDISYVFVHSQDRVLDWVLTQKAAAGAFSSDDHANMDEKKKADIAVLAQTERLPRHLVSVRSDLSPVIAGRLETILLAMHEDAEGRKILQKADGTTKFDQLPGGEAGMRRRLLDTFFSPDKK